jgi:DNA mismatch repair protein MutS
MFKRFFTSSEDVPQKRPNLSVDFISLMWPGDPEKLPSDQPQQWQSDLGLIDLVKAMSVSGRYQSTIYRTLTQLTTDSRVIAWRQDTLRDFINNPQLVERIEALLPRLTAMGESSVLLGNRKQNLLVQTGERLAELELFIEAVQELYETISNAAIQSESLKTLQRNLNSVIENVDFQALREQLPQLREPFGQIKSLTIGINLDFQLRPESAVLLMVNNHKLGSASSLLERMIGPPEEGYEATGIAPLNYLPRQPELRPYDPFYQDLEKLMTHVAKPIASELARYTRISSQPLRQLEYELAFYVSAARLYNRLLSYEISLCFPQALSRDSRHTEIKTLVNVNLCLKSDTQMVPSDVLLDDEGRIAVLTGPNSGGKTTYIQAVGLAQAMFQAGLFICADDAQMSPVDYILTHFPALETRQQGRLAEEAERLRKVFHHVTSSSLVLLNETFSSTSAGEAVFLAQDVLGGLRAIGVRAIFATHLVELVDHLDEISILISGDSNIFSLVAGINVDQNGEPVRTFKISRGKPLGRSYAREIARRHGISLQQILDAHHNRNGNASD